MYVVTKISHLLLVLSCRLIETDAKSLNSLSCQSGHSRRSSETSQISITSGSMSFQENAEEDLWGLWGKIINEWETWSKKKQPQLKVNVDPKPVRLSVCPSVDKLRSAGAARKVFLETLKTVLVDTNESHLERSISFCSFC